MKDEYFFYHLLLFHILILIIPNHPLSLFLFSTPPGRQFLRVLTAHGLLQDDERLSKIMDYINASDVDLTEKDVAFIRARSNLVERALNGRLIIPDFVKFTELLHQLYLETLPITSGNNYDHIPQLKKVDPNLFGMAVCTIDGQRFSVGDVSVPFCVQSCSKVITYAIAQTLNGEKEVHRHVGVEPSGRGFNALCLDERNHNLDINIRRALRLKGDAESLRLAEEMIIRPQIPHNPYINAGAIMCASLVKPKAAEDERFDYVMDIWKGE